MLSTVRQAAPTLALIRKVEALDNYNIVWGGIRPKHRPPKPLTTMTIREVLAWQDSIDHLYMSEAAGAYQMLEDTLRDVYAPAGYALDDLFDEATQDGIAVYLMKRRGFTKFLRGEISETTFANNLAHEWASFPLVNGPRRGKSVYGGDKAGNKALVSPEMVLEAVRATTEPVRAPKPPVRQPWWLRRYLSALTFPIKDAFK